ncbi:MAG: class I SAM-dependent methyltransferase, partial [Deltaproteobacteria bacterium]|nr:class I SAM-dependent methyltransferase [Deltaproteobacteria bacterium]
KRGDLYDMVILDPPPRFNRPGKRDFDAATGYKHLVARCVELLAPGGALFAGLNAMYVKDDDFEKAVMDGMRGTDINPDLLERIGPGADFPPGGDRPAARFLLVRRG